MRTEDPIGECWYILDAAEGATIIMGQHATSREEFAQMVEEGRWGELFNEVPTDGTVHVGSHCSRRRAPAPSSSREP